MSWISVVLGGESYLLYVYTDPVAGPSGRGVKLAGHSPTPDEGRAAVERPDATVRLAGLATTPVAPEWIAYLQLPAVPPWLTSALAGAPVASAPSSSPWRADPMLAGAFHPQYADDLEVTFVLVGKSTLERMWVRLDEVVPAIGYRGELLNTSHVDPALTAGTRVLVHPSRSHPPALWVPDGPCADNLRGYSSVCERCGFDLVLVPMAELARMQFPGAPPGAVFERLTTRCLLCQGTMHVARA